MKRHHELRHDVISPGPAETGGRRIWPHGCHGHYTIGMPRAREVRRQDKNTNKCLLLLAGVSLLIELQGSYLEYR